MFGRFVKKKTFYTKEYFKRHKNVDVGEHTYGIPSVKEYGNDSRLFIGSYCSIAEGVEILLGGNHRIDWATTYPFSALSERWLAAKNILGHPSSNGDVTIGSDVWIGKGVLILSGSTIGDGAVIGANSVVSGNIAPYAVVAGNPARFIRERFDQQTIGLLTKLKWWDLEDSQVNQLLPLLCSSKISQLIEALKKIRSYEN